MRSLSDSKYTTLYIVSLLCFSLKDFFKVKFNKIGLVHSNDASLSPYHACRLFCSLSPRKTNGIWNINGKPLRLSPEDS
jgi:hypothetical protein